MTKESQIKENILKVCETRNLEKKRGNWDMVYIFHHSRNYSHSVSNLYWKPS